MQGDTDFIVSDYVVFRVVIKLQALKRLVDVLYFKAEKVRLDYRCQKAVIFILSEYARLHVLPDNTNSKNLTPDLNEGGFSS